MLSHPLRQNYLNTQQLGITPLHMPGPQYFRENQRADNTVIIAETKPIRGGECEAYRFVPFFIL